MDSQTKTWLTSSELHHVIVRNDAHYPPLLNEIHDPPSTLYVKGRCVQALAKLGVAVVGSRHPTSAGRGLSRQFGANLGASGLAVVSGMALGIDAAAHEGALQARALTVAVMACGLDQVYPRRHGGLAARIIESGGLLVSEFAPGTGVRPHQFVQRNRIISGLTVGTLVVEASARSGSLTTARFAADQGRDVFAVPGSVQSPTSVGCHALIRDGAQLTESADDVLTVIGWQSQAIESHAQNLTELSDDESRLLKCMGYDAVGIDELVALSGWSVARVTSALTTLQLNGRVAHQLGRGYQQVPF